MPLPEQYDRMPTEELVRLGHERLAQAEVNWAILRSIIDELAARIPGSGPVGRTERLKRPTR